MGLITVVPEQEPEQLTEGGFGRSGVTFKVLGWIDTVLAVETGPEGNGATG
jgi:hypothetical protein